METEAGDLREDSAAIGTPSRLTTLLRRSVNLQEDEVRAALFAVIYFFCLLSSYYILRPLRDQMAIAGGIRNIPWLFTGTFVAMLLVVPLFGKVVSVFPRQKLIPLVYRFFILNILLFYLLLQFSSGQVYVARGFFIWLSVFNLFVVSVFWSFMVDLFSNEQGKRIFGFIAAGGTAGAILGSTIPILLAVPLGPVNLLLISALLLEGAVQCVYQLLRSPGVNKEKKQGAPASEEAIGGGILSGAIRVFQSPYMMGICVYIFLYTATSTFLYFQQAHIVKEAFEDPAQKIQVFSLMNLLVNVLTLVTQLFITGRFMRRFGVSPALAFLPVVVALSFTGLAVAPILLILIAAQVFRRASNFAISRPAREVLFTVVGREEKYKSKNFIDTVVYRGGDAVTAWVYAGLGVLGLGLSGIAVMTIPIAVGWAALAVLLGRKQEKLAGESS